jgi:hypothetical protein
MSTAFPGADRAPFFTTAAECRDWLAAAPLTDAGQMVAQLLGELKFLNDAALAPGDRLEILELLRGPVYESQEAFSRRFAGKPQPLAAAEQSAYAAASGLWHELVGGYMRCADACLANDAHMKPKAALTVQRALTALLAEQIETHRVSRSPSAEHWQMLHRVFATAEQLGVATQEVADVPHLGKQRGSAQSAYAEALLLGVANLHELGQRQIGWAVRWAKRWAPKIRVLSAAPEFSTQAIPLCVDLGSNLPPAYKPFATPGARWLDTAELRHSLKKRLTLLAQGEPPAKLNLGDDCAQPACEQLLTLIYGRWCKGAAIRGAERRPASGICRFVAGFEAIHYYAAGRKPFKRIAPTDLKTLRREQEEIATFGRVATHRDEGFSEQQGYAVEEWQTVEEWHAVNTSSAGMRITRPLERIGARVAHQQLTAVSPAGSQDWMLASVRWALVGDALDVGLNFFPGRPEAVALRPSGVASANEPHRPGFLLPAIPAIGQVASAVMPIGIFKPGRVVDTHADRPGRIRLTHLIERGADFERASYEPA